MADCTAYTTIAPYLFEMQKWLRLIRLSEVQQENKVYCDEFINKWMAFDQKGMVSATLQSKEIKLPWINTQKQLLLNRFMKQFLGDRAVISDFETMLKLISAESSNNQLQLLNLFCEVA